MTHEYVIALGGLIRGADAEAAGPAPTAIAWAADCVLAVGSDAAVRAVSRGDSTFLDLGGATVEALDPATALEPGAPADLAFWIADPGRISSDGTPSMRLVAVVRAGAFTEGDEHRGPFIRLARDGGSPGGA